MHANNELPALPDMTREEAQHALSQLRGTEERQKEILLELFERKGYKALSYQTWEEFAEIELGLSRQHFYKLLSAARVQRVLTSQEFLSHKGDISNHPSTSLHMGCLLELAKLPSAELQVRAFQEAVEV